MWTRLQPRTQAFAKVTAMLDCDRAAGARSRVVVATKAADPGQSGGPILTIVRVPREDGYAAAFSLPEMAPQFARRPIQLATTMNNVALPSQALRLVAPGERRAARSMRDVARIEVE